jgi:hypothetical protein
MEMLVRVGRRQEIPEVLALWREAGSAPATTTTPGSAAMSATL